MHVGLLIFLTVGELVCLLWFVYGLLLVCVFGWVVFFRFGNILLFLFGCGRCRLWRLLTVTCKCFAVGLRYFRLGA